MLRPHAGIANARIIDVIARRDGGYAVLTAAGIDLFDAELAKRTTIADEASGKLVELADGRFVAYSSGLAVSTNGAPFEKIETGGFLRDLVVTETGFLGLGHGQLLVDVAGARTVIELDDERLNGGITAWRGGAAIAGRAGLAIVGADGHELARSEEVWLTKPPIVVGSWLVSKDLRDVRVFDEQARVVAQLPLAATAMFAFGRGLLVHVDPAVDPDVSATLPHVFAYVELDDAGQPHERWRIELPRPWQIHVVGERAVVASEHAVHIIDTSGKVLAELPDQGYVHGAEPFAGGIVLRANGAVWWREHEPLEVLEHDVSPGVIRPVPVGLATSEDDVLFIWRTDVQGPERTTFATDLPFNTPLVIDGALLTIESAAQFSLRARSVYGYVIALRPKGPYRHAATRDEALRICERLIGRVFDGPIPEVARDGMYDASTRVLAQLPLSQTVDLYGRSWYATSSLDEETLPYVLQARQEFVRELATALGVRPRVLLAALRARKMKIEPPRPVANYDYLGTFTTSKTVHIADPAYIKRATRPTASGFQLALKIDVAEGIWHAFARNAKNDEGRTAELSVVHETGFDTYASDLMGSIGVDGGCAGVFDKACPKRNSDEPLEEGIAFGLGAVTWSGYGDGGYSVYVGKHKGEIVRIRLPFIEDEPEIDRLLARQTGASTKPYNVYTTFVVGDSVEHPKFGTGAVTRVGGDGKCDVRFPDGLRTLVHGRKR
jgi:hypothetical protein